MCLIIVHIVENVSNIVSKRNESYSQDIADCYIHLSLLCVENNNNNTSSQKYRQTL